MSDVKNKRVNIYIDQAAAQTALESLQRTADKLTKSIDAGRTAGKGMAKEIAKLDDTKAAIANVQTQIDKGLKPSFAQTQAQVSKLRNELRRLSEDDPGFGTKLEQYKTARAELDRLSVAMNGVQKSQRSWFAEAKTVAFGVLIGNTVQSALAAVGGYLSGIVGGNAAMSDSLAKVRQTTGLTAEEMKNLSTQLKTIDTRTAQKDLLKIAEIGGQFNVPKEQLKGFVEQMDRANVVLGSEFGGGAEQITTELALLRNVFTDIKSDHIDKDLGNIGNSLVTLAQEGAATAPIISDFAKRLSPLIATAHITSGEILGLGATMQELAVNPERGGTAVVKLFDKMISNATAFAKVAGVSVDDFKKKLESDTWGAFLQVLEGFKKGGSNVVGLNSTIQDLETSGVGAKEVLVKLSQNIDLLKGRSDLATESLKEQKKITEQFSINNNTLGAETEKLSKKIAAFATSRTLTEFFTSSVAVISKFIDVLKAIPGYISNNKTAFTLLAIGIATLNASYIKAAVIITRDTALKIYNATVTRLTAASSTIAIAAQAAYIQITGLLTGRIALATAAQRLWNITLALGAGPIGVIIIAAGALVLVLGNLLGAFKTVNAEQKLLGDVQQRASEDVASQRASLDTLTNAVQNNALSLVDRKKALVGLISINPAYLSGLTLENSKTAEGKKIIDDYVASLDRMARAKATQSLKEDLYKKSVEAAVKSQQASLNVPTSSAGIGFQAGLQVLGLGASTGLGKALAADEELKKSQADINALNAVNNNQITEANKLIDAEQKKMQGLKSDSKEYKNEQVKLNDLVATRNVLLGLDPTGNAAGKLNTDLTTSSGLIDELRAKIKVLDDALGGLGSKELISKNRADRKKLQDELDALEGKGADRKAKKEDNERNRLLKKLQDFQFELEQIGKVSDEKEIDRISREYDELIKEASKYSLSIVKLEKAKNSAIAYLLDQEEKKRSEMLRKQNELATQETYKNFIDSAVDSGENKKDVETKKYAADLISKKQLEENIRNIDSETLDFEIAIAQSFLGISKQAATDLLKFKIQKNKEEIADAVRTKEQRKALLEKEADAKGASSILKTQPGTKARLDAELAELLRHKTKEIDAVKETTLQGESEIKEQLDLINEKYRREQAEKNYQFWVAQIQQTLEFIQSAVSIGEKISQVKTNNENAALAKELKANDVRKNSIKKLEDSKVISAQESRRRLRVIELEEEKRKEDLDKKQHARQRKFAIAQAIINGALAVTKILAETPKFDFGVATAIEIGLAVATTAAEVAVIASQKFADGGKVKPNRLKNGLIDDDPNIPTQPNGDSVLATVKPGEVLLNENQQQRLGGADTFKKIGVPGFAGGGVVKPFWKTRPFEKLDVPGITRGMKVVKYAEGGLVRAAADQQESLNNQPPVIIENKDDEMKDLMKGILYRLENPVAPEWSLKNLELAQDQKKRISNDAALK